MQDLATGRIARVGSRQYLIEDVVFPPEPHQDTLVRLSCLEDDAQGEPLEVLWEREVDAQVIGDSSWESITRRGFDDPRRFSAYLHTLKWNCVTSTNPRLFQAPYRAGIEVKAYQLEPLRKASCRSRRTRAGVGPATPPRNHTRPAVRRVREGLREMVARRRR